MPTALDLFERHHLAVFRFLRRMGESPADAEDATQDVFVRVVQALSSYEERQSERAWVFRIARNLLLDRWRARGRAPMAETFVDAAHGRVAELRADRFDIDQALTRLVDGEREAFVLREVGGLSYVEIAAATGSTPDAVRSRIHRARLALREALGGARPSLAGAMRRGSAGPAVHRRHDMDSSEVLSAFVDGEPSSTSRTRCGARGSQGSREVLIDFVRLREAVADEVGPRRSPSGACAAGWGERSSAACHGCCASAAALTVAPWQALAPSTSCAAFAHVRRRTSRRCPRG